MRAEILLKLVDEGVAGDDEVGVGDGESTTQ